MKQSGISEITANGQLSSFGWHFDPTMHPASMP